MFHDIEKFESNLFESKMFPNFKEDDFQLPLLEKRQHSQIDFQEEDYIFENKRQKIFQEEDFNNFLSHEPFQGSLLLQQFPTQGDSLYSNQALSHDNLDYDYENGLFTFVSKENEPSIIQQDFQCQSVSYLEEEKQVSTIQENEQKPKKREAKRAAKESKPAKSQREAGQKSKKEQIAVEVVLVPVITSSNQSSSTQGLKPKLKLDQGFKSVLRGARKALKEIFDSQKLSTGKHHWNEENWIKKVSILLENLGFNNPSEQDICAVTLMLYPAFGPSEKNDTYQHTRIYRAIGENGIDLFKRIFDNNNKELRQRFFSNLLIQKLWPFMMKVMTEKHCFSKAPSQELLPTYVKITEITQEFGLCMAPWWVKKY